jgi:hypothetical protein
VITDRARIGDLFMSFIHTCQLNKVNSFDYLTQLQKNIKEALAAPQKWMPWNYHQNIPKNNPLSSKPPQYQQTLLLGLKAWRRCLIFGCDNPKLTTCDNAKLTSP